MWFNVYIKMSYLVEPEFWISDHTIPSYLVRSPVPSPIFVRKPLRKSSVWLVESHQTTGPVGWIQEKKKNMTSPCLSGKKKTSNQHRILQIRLNYTFCWLGETTLITMKSSQITLTSDNHIQNLNKLQWNSLEMTIKISRSWCLKSHLITIKSNSML